MTYEDPEALLRRLKLGREEFCQRLLTMLILGGPYPRWNTRSRPSERGARFLAALHAMSFGEPSPPNAEVFVDEFEMPARHADEKAGWPDYAVLWNDRTWIIELKTEASSHRVEQLPLYLAQATHHYPRTAVDLTYITPPLKKASPALQDHQRYAHVTWTQLAPVIRETWGEPQEAAHVRDRLLATIEGLSQPAAEWRASLKQPAHLPPPSLDDALDLAKATAVDRRQRVLDMAFEDGQAMEDFRVQLRDACAADPELQHVRPWSWSWSSSGQPMSESGVEHGVEIRLSYYT